MKYVNATSRHPLRGFVLAELIVVLAISSLVLFAMLAGLIAIVRGLQPQQIAISGETLPIAPTFGSFPSAVRLHQTFTDRVATARAIYVFGGRHLSIPADAPAAQQQPLKAQKLPIISDFSPGLPLDAKTFRDLYATALGEPESSASRDDFSVAIVGSTGNSLGLTCWVQVRRTDVSVSDGSESVPYTVRDVRLWDQDGSMQRYAYAEKASQTTAIFIGAVHTWLRYKLNSAAEEGPACTVFPDPWVYAGARGRTDDLPPFSRFSYFLAVSP